MKLSILIKTYNEERNIERCLAAVLLAVEGLDAEVIVADSLSSDSTVKLASGYPVTIIQMTDAGDRGCGAGVQLGFQHAVGEFVYLLDGDMELQADFVKTGLKVMEATPDLAGVSGLLVDNQVTNYFDRYREKNKPAGRSGEVEWLSGGGMYRRSAVLGAGGYAGNRNLKAFEEAELGLRLRSSGWRMLRLPDVAVHHTGHPESTLALVKRQWRSGRLDSYGVLLKSAFHKPYLARVLRMCIHPIGVVAFWSLLAIFTLLSAHYALKTLTLLGCVAFIALIAKKRSLRDAAFSVLLWHVAALGMLRGLFANTLLSPVLPITSKTVLSNPNASNSDQI